MIDIKRQALSNSLTIAFDIVVVSYKNQSAKLSEGNGTNPQCMHIISSFSRLLHYTRECINAFRGMRSALDNGGSHVCEPYKHCAESEICAFDFIVRLSLNVGIDGDKSYINFKEQFYVWEFCL